ncbi:FAD-dependent monooxygenase, partial [Candidatus Bathyarchaeota archaeon]|nr:FAD-dependent monooxygenase [Candidatus Bathyarchaeota archaeon]
VYRFDLIKVMLEMLAEAGIKPCYGKKFSRVLSEDVEGVTWAFEDGATSSASMLVGADGIHSRVRSCIHPDVAPVFTKMIAVMAVVPREQLGADNDYPLPVTIMNKKHGAFIAAQQGRDGSELFIAKQRHFAEEPDREGWNRIINNKEWCVEFLRRGREDYPPVVSSLVSHIPIDTIRLWPFYVIPKLESWTSETGRVVILGDAAHAIPPTAGQGVNQAFEDVYTFARVVGKLREDLTLEVFSVLQQWQKKRQERVDGILELTVSINKRRMPAQSGEEVAAEPFDLQWLYNVDLDSIVEEVISAT